jgi:oligoendopeptidase F
MSFKYIAFEKTASNTQTKEIPERPEIDIIYKWRTEDVFSNDVEWEQNYSYLEKVINELNQFQGKLRDSPQILFNCLKTRDKIGAIFDKLSIYATLKSDEDTRNTKYQEYRDQISGLSVKINQKEAYIQPEILCISENKLQRFLKDFEELQVYIHYFTDLFRSKKHVLNEEGENLLALVGDMSQTLYKIFTMFNDADIKFPVVIDEKGYKVEISKGNFSVFMKSSDRRIRKNVFVGMYGTYQQWINTLSATLSGVIKKNIYYAKARKYENALKAALHVDNIPRVVYENVLNTINKNLTPLHRYISLRKKILKIDKVYPWDLYVPLVKEWKWEIPYEESVEIIQKALAPLGKEYLSIIKTGFTSRWLDVYENKGKRSGAYSTYAYGVPHPYMLLNYQNMLDDMFTVAHEMGHSMHSYFTTKNQPYIYSNYTIFVAEVASTLNEVLLMHYMMKTTKDKRKKLYLVNQYIDQIRGTLYIQTIFAEFEKYIHERQEEGKALTPDILNSITKELYLRYYGPDFAMDSLYGINWCRIPHFYYNFYVYQYVTGIAAATTLSQKIIQGNIKAQEAYLDFLKSGCSDYSINLLTKTGVDMTSPEPIKATTTLFSDLVNEMENLLDS